MNDINEIEEALRKSLPFDFSIKRTKTGFDIFYGDRNPFNTLIHSIPVAKMTLEPTPKLATVQIPFPYSYITMLRFSIEKEITSTITNGYVAGCLRIAAGMGLLEKAVGAKIEVEEYSE